MKTIALSSIAPNPDNPRIMRDKPFECLVASIKEDPQFLEKRGIVPADGVILGGNRRYRAIQEALKDKAFRDKVGVKKRDEVPATWIQDASDWTVEQRRRFIVIDNGPPGMSGEYDYGMLANQFSDLPLEAWGLAPTQDVEPVSPPEFPEYGEETGKGVTRCTCPTCGHEHATKN